jgi:PAS domain S-box-containing protein
MGDTIRVLQVDDDPGFRDMTATFLQQESDQFEIIEEGRGADARERVNDVGGDIDCVVSDHTLPDMSGVELLRSLRDDYPELPFILFTGKGSEAVARDALRAGATDYLQKQSGTQQYNLLANRIRNAVEQRQAEQRVLELERVPTLVRDINQAFVRASSKDEIETKVCELFRESDPYLMTDDGGVAFYFWEITERQRQQRRFEAVFNNTYQFTGFLDPDGTLLEANDAALSFGGLDREEVVGKPLWETYWFQASEEARSVAKTAVERARNGEMFREEIRVQGADDDAIIDFSVRPVTNEQGEVTSLIPEGRDITDRKRREQELAESEARYRTLAENFPNGAVFLFDDDLRYQIVSGTGFDPIETTPEDLIGNTVHEVEPYSEATVEMLEPIMESTLAGNEETIELSYEGHAYKLRSIPIRDDDGEVIAGFYISQDITEQREREAELERQNERLQEFASVVSHDLRNPLNIIAGRLELAKGDCDSEHLIEAEAALDRCQTLVDDLLTLAREGQGVAETEPVHLADVLDGCWTTVEPGEAMLRHDVDCTIQADRSRLQQLLENLFRNAIDHAGPEVTVEVGQLEDGFYIADNGPGIPDDIRDEVFQSAYSTVEDNTGFGLAIVKEIVSAHGWDITIEERASGGARFEITGVESL